MGRMADSTTNEELVLNIADIKKAASKKLNKMTRDYFNKGANEMVTLRENESSFDRFKIRSRILVNVENLDTSTTILGENISFPLAFSPSAMHCLAHPEGERATSRAAAQAGIPMVLSTYSTVSMEDVIAQSVKKHNPYAFQLSILKDRSTSLKWIKRAEAAGYKALFITVDAPVLGKRWNEVRNRLALPVEYSLPHLDQEETTLPNGIKSKRPARDHHISGRDPSNSWQSVIPWVKENTNLQIWLKGIYSPEDVLLAIKYQLDGVIISNHGGRQLDGVAATIDALPECAAVARGRIKIGIDGGIRRGSDIFKALALGADCCFVGRVPIWGLAYNGAEGVKQAVEILRQEFQTTMQLAGCSTIKDITRQHLSVIGANGLLCRL